MPELPRLSVALRAFGTVSQGSEATGPANDLALRKSLALEKQKARSPSWQSFKDFIKQHANAGPSDEVEDVLKQLLTTAKHIVGSEESPETIECAAAFLFDVFKSVESVGQREAHQLRCTFGPFPATAATKSCQLVKRIINWLPASCLEELASEREEGDGAPTNEEFGHNIKFAMSYDADEENVSTDDDDEEDKADAGFKDFDMRYVDKVAAPSERDLASGKRKNDFSLKFDSLWLKDTIRKYFEGSEAALNFGLDELSTTVYDVLCSERKDEELQNELFDLLGFDRFELIEQLLVNRTNIIKGFTAESTRAILQQIPKKKVENERPTYGCQVTVQSLEEKTLAKQLRKEGKRLKKDGKFTTEENQIAEALDMTPEELRAARVAELEAAKCAPLFSGVSSYIRQEKYPFVFDALTEAQHSSAFIAGSKIVLPENFKKKDDKLYEEISIPPSEPAPTDIGKNRIRIDSLDEIAQRAFPKTESLNRIQSVVFNAAYKTNENLLICAPTGAGKTNIAMLTILRELKQHIHQGTIKKDEFKIVYVAPMKALAAEMVRNFGGRLQALGITVKELTGDMSLTKQEILNTQMLVTTPEKWDVVTRKSTGDVALAQLVRLLIIDEVHLLHDDRGPVIETLVARTKRQVESSQSMIRIVGLSATLPNYVDVAEFLNVNPYTGLFFFDGRFRPVPLGQTFIGIKTVNKMKLLKDFNDVCYEKVLKQVKEGHQVMVFVHARNETVRTAFSLIELAKNKGDSSYFEADQSRALGDAQRAIGNSRNKQLREMFVDGFGIHHAGMLRQDRNLVERYFSEGHIKVLVCTATLAWGVNLPAHAVIIKGTQIYDAKRGSFVDLGILDVMQIFGRAGRPQFDTFGHGTIITTHDKLSHYLSLMTRQNPIESQFIHSLTDNLNAEISLGTVTNVEEAVTWLSYTYLFVRMRKNPLVYGIPNNYWQDDPFLEQHRRELIIKAARDLDKTKMIRFDENTNYLFSTDLGRTASNFYIKYDTVEVINEMSKPMMTEGEILNLVSNSQEFEQIKVREDEMDELDRLTSDGCEMIIFGGKENTHGKVNILLQSYISRVSVESFSLISDMAYIAQNAARIMRALFEMAMKNCNPLLASRLLEMCKMIDKRLWSFENPMRQFSVLSPEILTKLENKRLLPEKMREMDSKEIGLMVNYQKMGTVIKRCVHQIPNLELDASIQPITRTVLRVRLDITADFKWDDKVHGSSAEPFWIWVEDPENNHIYHTEYFVLHKKQVLSKEPQQLVFTIPIFEPLPTQYYVKAVSDRWLGCSVTHPMSFQHLILPEQHPPHTDLLNLQPLPITALKDLKYQSLYKFSHFNPVQTQIFHTLYHSDCNVLLGAPTGSGKTVAAELAIFRVFNEYPNAKAVYIAPLKALVRERMEDWKVRIEQKLGKKVVELTGDVTPDMRAVANADLIVTTPEKWDGVSRSWQTRSYVKAVALLVIDEIHLLGDDRGPVLEVIVSRTNFISSHTEKPVRVVGLSTALANARDLADWLAIKEMGLFNFRPSVRPVPLEVHVQGFPGQHYCPRMATMNKPTFQAIKTHSPTKPVLIFVSSRRQTRLTALDLIAFLAAEDNPKQWLHLAEDDMEQICSSVKESNLKLTLAFGIGIHHAGLTERDRKVVEELFVNQKIQVLIATSTLAWGVNFPAHLVVVKGTEYFDGKTRRYVDFPITDVLQMMGRAGRPQFDNQGVAVILVHDVKKHFYKKFLYEPFPVESNLLEVMAEHLNAEVVSGTISSKQDAMDYITWTYFFRRLLRNPSFYHLEDTDHACINKYLSGLVGKSLMELEMSYCLEVEEDNRTITPKTLGRIASYYYLKHATVRMFRDSLGPQSSIPELIDILSNAAEFAELPVRHNEDQLNGDLANQIPLEVSMSSLDSSHTKANILLQAYFSHLTLPSSDYHTDTKSVLDQALRVLQAMLDVAADEGWLVTSLNIIMLVQMVVQGRWWNDSTLLTLPHIQTYHVSCLRSLAKRADAMSSQEFKGPIESLPQLMDVCDGGRRALESVLDGIMEQQQINQLYEVLVGMPQIEVNVEVKGWLPEEKQSSVKRLDIRYTGGIRSESCWTPVHADQEYVLAVSLRRLNIQKKRDSKAHSLTFPKPKDEGWVIVVGNVETREVIALKRVGCVRSRTCANISVFTPEAMGRVIYTVYLMSDAYQGLDQQFDVCLDVVEASIEAQVNSELKPEGDDEDGW